MGKAFPFPPDAKPIQIYRFFWEKLFALINCAQFVAICNMKVGFEPGISAVVKAHPGQINMAARLGMAH